ncbi:Ribosome-recycling factor-like protein [Drosera capensis]
MMLLRRILAHRTTASLLLRSSSHHPNIHQISSSISIAVRSSLESSSRIPRLIDLANWSCRRGFAKGRKSKANEDEDAMKVTEDIGPSVRASTASLMESAIDALSRELSKIRTGRASAGMLDHIIVETGGVKMPLNRLAVVSVIDSKTLSVMPYDPDNLKDLEKAITSSPLGLNPKTDGQRLIAAVPPLTKETVQAMCKVVSKSSEDVKLSIRRARQKALDAIKKAGSSYPKDSAKKLEKEIDELTKKFAKSAEDICKTKEKELHEG